MARKNISPKSLMLSLGITALVILLSGFGFYETIENKLLDLRFQVRGPVPTRDDIATVDIDVRALQTEGRFQDWTRDKHARIIDFAHEHQVRMLAFDIYFPEPSTPAILATDLNSLPDDRLDRASLSALIRDYDRDMINAMTAADNVFLAQSFKPKDSGTDAVKPRTADQDSSLVLLKRWSQEFSGPTDHLFSFYDIEAPIQPFIPAAHAIAYAQAVGDPDGVIRRYPLIGFYDGRIYPSMALLMACDYWQVEFQNVSIIPGDAVILPRPDGSEVRIPISREGYMMVNWAGDWKDDFPHYPYGLISDFSESEQANYILSRIKPLINEQPDLIMDFNQLTEAARALNLKPAALVPDAVSRLFMAGKIEAALTENPSLMPPEFFSSQGIPPDRIPPALSSFFLELKSNLVLAELLSAEPGLSADSILARTTLADQPHTRRNLAILANLVRSGQLPEQCPLYFYPAGTTITLQDRAVVPFEFSGKMLFYGLTATGTHDLNPMPFNARYPMVGLHANALNTILENRFILRAPRLAEIGLIGLIGLMIGLIIPRLHPVAGAGFSLGLGSLFVIGNYLLFIRHGWWIDGIGPLAVMALGYLGLTVTNYIEQEKDKKFLHTTFKAYLSPELIDKMVAEQQTPMLGGEEGVRTAFFTDVQKFSTIAETLKSPTRLVDLLNEYLTAMTDSLLAHEGTLDKYEGDALIAFFGAPVHMTDHAEKACLAALDMQQRLGDLRKVWAMADPPWPPLVNNMMMRIGINSGPMVTGNMGSKTRMNYTMMGDTVNLAARLESLSKHYGIYTACSGDTIELVTTNQIAFRLLDKVRVVGKSIPIPIYEIMGFASELDQDRLDLRDLFAEAFDAYQKRDWSRALALFDRALPLEPEGHNPYVPTTPAAVFIARCQKYSDSPPPDDWDGVYTARSK